MQPQPKLPFGKYAGRHIWEVPKSYLRWALRAGALRGWFRSAAVAMLAGEPLPPAPAPTQTLVRAEDLNDLRGSVQIQRVEDLNLTQAGDAHECARASRAREDYVGRLVAHRERADDVPRREVYDAHGVREPVDDPSLAVAPGRAFVPGASRRRRVRLAASHALPA